VRASLVAPLLLVLACQRTTEFIGSPPVWNCGARCFRDENLEGLPGSVQQFFAVAPDPDPANRPELVYPRAGSMHPIDLPDITFQWRSAGGNGRYYRVRIAPVDAPDIRYELYIPCRPPPADPIAPKSDECHYPVPARAWELVASDLRGTAVTVTLDAADDQPAVVATSAPVTLSFSPVAIQGGFYYLSRSRVVRTLPGAGAQPVVQPTDRFACVGCHAVSRDGRTLAFSYDRSYLGTARAEDPATLLVSPAPSPQPDAATVSLNADGSLAAVSLDGRLSVRETATGRVIAPDPGLGRLYFAEWSPDGKLLVATLASEAENPYTVNDGSIVLVSWEGTSFGPLYTLVAGDAAQFHFHPAWSPDGAWVVFASAPRPGRSHDNPQARLRLVPRNGGTPVELTAATAGQGAGWPRFTTAVHDSGNLLYLSFDSKLDYGYLLRNSADPAGARPQIWLTALDLRKLPGDPSSAPTYPPFPFQDLHVANVLGTWTHQLVCGPRSPCPERSRCESDHCVRDVLNPTRFP
jgi:hypothetical protein